MATFFCFVKDVFPVFAKVQGNNDTRIRKKKMETINSVNLAYETETAWKMPHCMYK